MGLTYGQSIIMPCAAGFAYSNNGFNNTAAGSVMTYTCGQYGILYPTSTKCSTTVTSTTCNNGTIGYYACPIGYSGNFTQTCSGGNTLSSSFNTANNCTSITCSGTAIGSSVTNNVSSPCPTGWTSMATATSACSLPVASLTNGSYSSSAHTAGTSAAAQAILAQTYCAADYSACAGTAIRSGTACPYGQTGNYVQQCNGSNYVTITNTCVPVTCGGDAVGSWRSVTDQACPNGLTGTVIEICMYTDTTINTCSNGCAAAQWMRSYVGCS
jgi:hypothetical protein